MTSVVSPPSERPRIRRARRADLLDIYRLEQEVFPQPWPFSAFEQFLGEPGFMVAEDDTIVGYVVADTAATPTGEIGHVKDLAVDEAHRRRGLGSLLLSRALDTLAGRVETVKLEVRESNDGAQRLYERFGFDFWRRIPGYYSNGEDALVLVYEF